MGGFGCSKWDVKVWIPGSKLGRVNPLGPLFLLDK